MVQEQFLACFLTFDDEDTFTVKCTGMIMGKPEVAH